MNDKATPKYALKKTQQEQAIAQARPLWIHAASGEIEYARPVIRELKKAYPQVPILVTYSSPSAKKILANLSDVDAWAPMPWEFSGQIQAFIEFWNPRAILFARTDVWPVLADVAKKRSLPMVLFSATFADNSSRLSRLSMPLTKFTLSCLSEIHCVSSDDFANLQPLNLNTPCFVSGDTRFDQVFHRLSNPKPLRSELIPGPEELVFIAGSTWPEDESVLAGALPQVQRHQIRIIIAPHETDNSHLRSLEEKLEESNLKYVRYSSAEIWPPEAILIIDQVGVLAELYTWGDIAFIGGSFKKQVHSVMEALAAGLPVLVGPYHKNNREALYYQKKTYSSGMIVQVIHNSSDIVLLLERFKKQIEAGSPIKEEIQREISKNKNSTQKLMLALGKILE